MRKPVAASNLLAAMRSSILAAAIVSTTCAVARATPPPGPPVPAPPGSVKELAAEPQDAACAPGCPHVHVGTWRRSWSPSQVDTGIGGLRLSGVRVRGSDADTEGTPFGVQLAGQNQAYGAWGYYDYRTQSFVWIGGGRAGFEGGLGADVAAGMRTRNDDGLAAFVRLGARGWLFGNDWLYSSLLEVPQVQLGWQWLHSGKVVELAARTGPVLAGRYNTGHDALRRLGDSFELGGHAAVHVEPAHVEIAWARVFAASPGGAVDIVQGSLCGQVAVLALCLDGSYFHGEQSHSGVRTVIGPAEALYGGLTLGFGRGVIPRELRQPEREPHRRGGAKP